MAFQVSFGGQAWRTDHLTIDEAIGLEEATGNSWLEINPFRSAVHAKEIIVTFLARDMDRDTARAKVGAASIGEILDGVTVVKDDLPDVYEDGIPKAEDGPSTDG